jgi:hypothetical protein
MDKLRGNRVAAVLMLAATSMASVAATGTLPALFIALVIVLTSTSLVFAVRGGTRAG